MDTKPIIRIDDVLLHKNLTGSMKNALRKKSFFEHFKEMDEILERYETTTILSVLAEGIHVYPEWVKYILERKHRYNIEMHGYSHYYYHVMSEDEGFVSLLNAKEMIEEAFGVKVSRWHPPFGRLYFPEWGVRVCERLKIKLNNRGIEQRVMLFHYWNSRDKRRLQNIMNMDGLQFKEPNRVLA